MGETTAYDVFRLEGQIRKHEALNNLKSELLKLFRPFDKSVELHRLLRPFQQPKAYDVLFRMRDISAEYSKLAEMLDELSKNPQESLKYVVLNEKRIVDHYKIDIVKAGINYSEHYEVMPGIPYVQGVPLVLVTTRTIEKTVENLKAATGIVSIIKEQVYKKQ